MLRFLLFSIGLATIAGIPVSLTQPKLANLVGVSDSLISEVNGDANSTWVAGRNENFDGMSQEDIRKMFGLNMNRKYHSVPVKVHSDIPDSDVPDTFNSYDRWPGFCHPIRDQARCGSCWAFAASEVLSDRFAIASNGTINKILSPEDMVSCDTTDSGCNGGYLDHAWEYLVDHGIVTETCFPYGSQKGKAPACIHACVDGKEPFVKYKAFDFYQLKTELDIQKEIMTNGPVEAGFTVYTSFMAYKTGVYHKRLLDIPEGGHAIKIVGWGIEAPLHKWQKPQKYWLCANSWTDKWGDKGFFKIRRGTNIKGGSECDIQSQVFAGHPLTKK